VLDIVDTRCNHEVYVSLYLYKIESMLNTLIHCVSFTLGRMHSD